MAKAVGHGTQDPYYKWLEHAKNNGISPEDAEYVWANRDRLDQLTYENGGQPDLSSLQNTIGNQTEAANRYGVHTETLSDGTVMSYQSGYDQTTGNPTLSINNGQDGVAITKTEDGYDVDYYSMMSGAMSMADVTTVEEALQRIAQVLFQFLQSGLKNLMSTDISDLFGSSEDREDITNIFGALASGNAKDEQQLNGLLSGNNELNILPGAPSIGPGVNTQYQVQNLGEDPRDF